MKEMKILGRCPKCGYLLTEERPLCPRCGLGASSTGGASPAAGSGRSLIDLLRDPKEIRALAWLVGLAVPVWALGLVLTMGIILVYGGLFALSFLIAELFMAAYIKTNAVEVSQGQLPEVYEIVRKCCEKLGFSQPSVYVLQESMWNAFAMTVAGRRVVVLMSGAVDSVLLKGDMEQLSWLVGHEIGHHFAGHFSFWRRLAESSFWLPWFLFWYKRRAELSCDRIGLYCSGKLTTSMSALANMTVGAQLASRVDPAAAIRQWNMHKDEFFVRYRTIYSTHPHKLWRFAEMASAAQALGIPD